MKDTDEQPGGDTQGEIRKGSKSRSFCPCGVKVCSPPGIVRVCGHQPQSSLTSHYWNFLWQFHHVGVIDYELRFQFLSPLWRWGGGAENSVLNHDSVFLVTQSSFRSLTHTVTSLERKTLASPKKCQKIQELCVRTLKRKTKCQNKNSPSISIIRVLWTLCLEPEAETSMSISFYFTMQKTILGLLVKHRLVDG